MTFGTGFLRAYAISAGGWFVWLIMQKDKMPAGLVGWVAFGSA
jgi:hypothetical protein